MKFRKYSEWNDDDYDIKTLYWSKEKKQNTKVKLKLSFPNQNVKLNVHKVSYRCCSFFALTNTTFLRIKLIDFFAVFIYSILIDFYK